MQFPPHHLILFFLSILFTTTPTAAYPSNRRAPPASPYPVDSPTQSQTETLTNEDFNSSSANPPTPITPETSNPLPLHKRRGGEGDNRRWLPSSDSGLSATEIEDFLANPGGVIDNAREVLVVHDVSHGGTSERRDE